MDFLVHGKIKSRALIRRRLSPDAAAVALQDALHRGQPDARAGELRFGMEPLEGREQFVRISHVKSRAVVADEEDRNGIGRRAVRQALVLEPS